VKVRLLLLVITCLAAGAIGAAPSQSGADRITVHANRVLAPVNPLLFGQNFGPWMNTTEGYVADYQAGGVTLLRAPGGNYGDENDLYANNLDDLAALAKALNAQVSVQARLWRAGTPEKAARLVRYCNVEHNYGFRYWEVGNEPDLYIKRANTAGDPTFDATWYNARFREFAAAMKAVDPTIQVVGPAVTDGWPEWMPAFITANGDSVDVLSWHWYGNGSQMTDAQVLATPPDIEWQVKTIRGWWTDPAVNPLGYQRPLPPLFLSEYNVSWASSVRRQLGSQVAALWNAEVVGRMANLGVEMAAHFALQGTGWQGLIGMLDDPRPVYGVYRLYSQWGTRQVAATSSDEALLPAFASLRDDGSLAVLVVNKDPQQARQATLAFEGFNPAEQAQVWLQDETHLAAQLPPAGVAGNMPYTFSPYSVTLLVLKPAPPVNWGLWVGLGLAVAALGGLGFGLWRRSVGERKTESEGDA
jgi:hypothetical protein